MTAISRSTVYLLGLQSLRSMVRRLRPGLFRQGLRSPSEEEARHRSDWLPALLPRCPVHASDTATRKSIHEFLRFPRLADQEMPLPLRIARIAKDSGCGTVRRRVTLGWLDQEFSGLRRGSTEHLKSGDSLRPRSLCNRPSVPEVP